MPIKHKYIPKDWDVAELKTDYLDEDEVRLVEFVEQTACRINEVIRFRVVEDMLDDGHILLYTKKSRHSN